MKIEEAIKLIDNIIFIHGMNWEHQRNEALRLGIEALKRIQIIRKSYLPGSTHLLPGETKE